MFRGDYVAKCRTGLPACGWRLPGPVLCCLIMPPVPSVTAITLRWLLRLRWLAVAGQVTAIAFGALVLHLELPLLPLLGVVFATAFSNSILLDQGRREQPDREWTLAAVIGMDVVLLTVMLYFTGGASNPFTSFYLVLVALAAMALGVRWLSAIVALAAAGYGFIFYHHEPLSGPPGIGEIGCPAYGFHLKGMAVAFFLTALCIAFFVQRMHRSLRSREAALVEAEGKAARADQFRALAALAAGVAHELGSPLGTIAVASKELERSLQHTQPDAVPLEDARLIRQEVERCRSILDRLDRRSTGGTGDAAEICTAAVLTAELTEALPPPCQGRLHTTDHSGGAPLQLPRQPVVQSLLVLIQNACEADTAGQRVELEITAREGEVEFAVHDRGPGLSPAAQKHAGEPFFTTKPPRHGMGLGLFLVRTLALQLGGELRHRAHPGGGTSAILTLPA